MSGSRASNVDQRIAIKQPPQVEGGLYYSSCAPADLADLAADSERAKECWDLTDAIIARITGDDASGSGTK